MEDASINSEREPLFGSGSRTINTYRPKDHYNLVYIIFIFLGMSCLLPWNFFITAKEYFNYKFRNTSLPVNHTDLFSGKLKENPNQRLFESYLSMTAMITNLVFMILTTLFVRSIPINVRMITSMVIVAAVFAVTTALVLVDTDEWQFSFLALTLLSAAIAMAAVSVTTGSVIGLSCLFPVRYTQANMIGQAAGGTFSALAQIISKVGNGSVTDSAFGFFLTASLFTILSVFSYGALYKLKFSKFYLSNQIHALKNVDNEIPAYREIISYREYFTSILSKIWPYTICSFMTFLVTLACFPSICSSIRSTEDSSSEWADYFTPVACFLLFNVGDCLGRIFTSVCRPSQHHKYFLLLIAVLRVVYIPLFLYCNLEPSGNIRKFPVFFDNDAYPMIFIVTLGISNGYLSTLMFMLAPAQVPIEQAEGAGVIMALSLTIGLTTGSLFSYLFMKLF